MKRNLELRDAAKVAGVYLWEVADAYGLSEGAFCRRLRKELPQVERQRVLGIIEKIGRQKGGKLSE